MKRRFGMAAIATVGGLVTATACGLFIDPDKLIADNGEPDDSAAPVRDVNGGDDDGGSTDAGLDVPVIPVVPACVPPAPAGTKGPYAVVFAQGGAAACPSGYLATAVATGKTDLKGQPVTCGTNGCSCTTTVEAGCPLKVSFWDDGLCKVASGDLAESVSTCADFPSKPYAYKVDVTAVSPMCQPQGSTSPTSKPPAVYDTSVAACGVDPGITREPCDGGDVALSPVVNARTCVVLSGAGKCAAPYGTAYPISTTGSVNDTRGCACTCPSGGTTTCNGGNVQAFGGGGCAGGVFDAGIGICRVRAGADSVSADVPVPGGFVTCQAGSTASGEVQPINDVTLCCLR